MAWFPLLILLLAPAAPASPGETQYLLFQLFPPPSPKDIEQNQAFPPGEEPEKAIASLLSAIGSKGDATRKLGITLGPLTLAQSSVEVRGLIRDGFRIAKEKGVAIAFHLDDQMFWGAETGLRGQAGSLEWLNWDGTPNTGRRLDWSSKPLKIRPQLCLNSAPVRTAVKARAKEIGEEIRSGLSMLKAAKQEARFAGVIAGWETQIGHDFATGQSLGYCALANRAYSAKRPPKNPEGELVDIVREFIRLWAKGLADAGVPPQKIYAHLALSPQQQGGKRVEASAMGYGTPEVAFDKAYRPGFSTYPEEGLFDGLRQELTRRGSPAWISAEGTNILPGGLPGEVNMETYLARIFLHGGVAANIFSWGIGGEAQKGNPFRLVTEREEALNAYRKFLRGQRLVEKDRPANGLSASRLREKIQRVQQEAPAWAQRTGRGAEMQDQMKKLDEAILAERWEEADRRADTILGLMGK